MKELVAKELAKRVKSGEVIGVGTGSTVDAALVEIAKRVNAEKLSLKVVPSSYESSWRCQEIGLDVLYQGYNGELAWGFDGADEVNDKRWLIKGKGGALLQEKILAKKCKRFVVIVDESKMVSALGQNCLVPVEIIPEALSIAKEGIKSCGGTEISVRQATGKHGAVITEGGNLILDCRFSKITESLERDIKSIVGVVESGLFIGYADEVLMASSFGVRSM